MPSALTSEWTRLGVELVVKRQKSMEHRWKKLNLFDFLCRRPLLFPSFHRFSRRPVADQGLQRLGPRLCLDAGHLLAERHGEGAAAPAAAAASAAPAAAATASAARARRLGSIVAGSAWGDPEQGDWAELVECEPSGQVKKRFWEGLVSTHNY